MLISKANGKKTNCEFEIQFDVAYNPKICSKNK